jgi:di/tricarboxylate transporter
VLVAPPSYPSVAGCGITVHHMPLEVLLMMGTIIAAVLLFSWDRIPADVTALGILLFLILTRLLPADRAFAGFGSDVVVMMLGLLVIMAALNNTGVTHIAGRAILRWTDGGSDRLVLVVMVAAVALGAFMSNTAATAFFLPIVIGLARRAKVSAAKLLMPLAFASILASSLTLVSTSTNIIVSGLMTEYGVSPLGMFELTPVGLPIAIVGVAYMYLLGRRVVPDRIPAEEVDDPTVHLYLSEIVIGEGSSLAGKSLAESSLGSDLDLTVIWIVRERARYLVPRAKTRLQAGDVLLVEGARENVLRVKEVAGIDIRPEIKFSGPDLETVDVALSEVILLPGSPMIGRTLQGLRFRQQYGLQVLAISRHGERLSRKMSQIRLRMGDVLVLQGDRSRIAALERLGNLRILGSIEESLRSRQRAPVAIAIFGGVLLAVALEVLSLPVAMLLGAVLVFLTRCITPEEAYSQISWEALILIASMLGLGTAMEVTGTAELLAMHVVQWVGDASPLWLLSAFFGLTVLLTQPMSNQSAAVVVLPIAIRAATQLGLNPRSFAMMVALAASCSFLTPLEPSCLLVYGPGRYRFMDFVRVGLVPTVLIYIISIIMVPMLWPI